ncbi:hypothetical protein GCM10025868_42930 [Angustibacter aerolatus]|uniref:Nitrite/Sulfite reductase ferredoxin-like domain-containing protein n=1 Tax=Angustibacter aerolatus TaxID=1162965 RepID=A0ABQ6JNU0_9ACTN|nr:hypothetical protein GCM10025868_42930 [Angustibacter aerolatus]
MSCARLAGLRARVVVTPWRQVVLRDVDPDGLPAALALLQGPGFDAPGSAWDGVTACVGAPACRRALGDVRALAEQVVADRASGDEPVHLSACPRRCGRPATAHREIVLGAA